MKYSIIALVASLLVSVSAIACTPTKSGGASPDKEISVPNDSIMIPRPVAAKRLDGYLDVSQPLYLKFEAPDEVSESLTKYLRSSNLVIVGPALSKVPVNIVLSDDQSLPKSEEGYHLVITREGITVEARTQAGLFYGLQTVVQLKDMYGKSIPTWEITDWPRFGYRGLHLDVCRHFFSKEFVKKQIRMMATLKLNRLHLHLTDN